MNSRFLLLLVLISSSLFFAGCTKEQDNSPGTSAKTETPKVSQVKSEPVVIDPKLAAKGKDIYDQNCIFCHQPDAIGKPGFAPSLTNKELLSASSDKFLMGTIRDGRAGTGMPPFAHLGRSDVEAIVAFLRSHTHDSNKSAQIDAQPQSQGDPRLGRFWFDQICSTCHGTNGDGYIAGGTGTAIGKAGFLDKASDGFIRETIKHGRSNTRMLGFSGPEAMANLSDGEIDDIIAYLRTVPSKS